MKTKAICRYCTWYNNYERKRDTTVVKKNKKFLVEERKCSVLNDYVSEKTKACIEFLLMKYFWCDRDANFINIIVCKNRREKRKEGCVKCRQGKKLSKMWG